MAGEETQTANASARELFRIEQAKRGSSARREPSDPTPVPQSGDFPKAHDLRSGGKIRATNPSDANILNQALEANPDVQPYPTPNDDESPKGK